MEKPYVIYDSGWAFLAFFFGLFVVVPLVAYVLVSLPIENQRFLLTICAVLAGLSVLLGFYVDGQVKRRRRAKHGNT
jgi:hypothetical protein